MDPGDHHLAADPQKEVRRQHVRRGDADVTGHQRHLRYSVLLSSCHHDGTAVLANIQVYCEPVSVFAIVAPHCHQAIPSVALWDPSRIK